MSDALLSVTGQFSAALGTTSQALPAQSLWLDPQLPELSKVEAWLV